ncbi:hypothetical protein NC651_039135 [Populus alba x Populus x berolinensis]|nr:hypothetical protein NC651_039135 [Populus alba x Populus x berolinensis]
MLSSCLHVSEKFPRTFVWQSIADALARRQPISIYHESKSKTPSTTANALEDPLKFFLLYLDKVSLLLSGTLI